MVQNVKNGITGKCFVYIRNMYQGIKSLISMDGTTSDFIGRKPIAIFISL